MNEDRTRIFRITHIGNLPHILMQDGIWCGNEMIERSLPYVPIGDPQLTIKRSLKAVNVAAGGNLNDYVPFNFCPRSVMLHKIWRKGADTYGGGQEPIIHLIADVGRVRGTGTPCFFTNRNAYMRYADSIDDFDRLRELDWETIRSRKWKNTAEDPQRMERKMAEFLSYRFVPWSCFVGIGVYSESYREVASNFLHEAGASVPVKVMTGWYYP